MTAFSILIPHKHAPANDAALTIALSCIIANTRADYELLIDTTTPGEPYVILNEMARAARSEWLFFSNSDIFPAPGWDSALLALADPNTIVSATLVESGAIGVHPQNMHRNFGMTPDSFRRSEFEAFATSNPELPAGDGFVYYALVNRAAFLDAGGFDLSRGSFPFEPLDSYFWQSWQEAGKSIKRSAAFVYHLQNWSNPDEQKKAVRHEPT